MATHEVAVDGADVVIDATPGDASLAVFEQWEPVVASGAIVLDSANAATDTGLLVHADQSLAEKLQAALPQARLVKALNTFNIAVMTDPSVLSGPTPTSSRVTTRRPSPRSAAFCSTSAGRTPTSWTSALCDLPGRSSTDLVCHHSGTLARKEPLTSATDSVRALPRHLR